MGRIPCSHIHDFHMNWLFLPPATLYADPSYFCYTWDKTAQDLS
jgi:hypothetical protein